MKIIFLDVDGVLNCSSTKEQLDAFIFVEDKKIELLKQLVECTGAKIVLSSTWRHGWSDLEHGLETRDAQHFIALREKLREYEIELFDYTPITNGAMDRRGEEIRLWMEKHPEGTIEAMVVLDDLNGVYIRPYAKYLVRTSFAKGLEPKHVELAVKVLNKTESQTS
jgi:hypothetical protein